MSDRRHEEEIARVHVVEEEEIATDHEPDREDDPDDARRRRLTVSDFGHRMMRDGEAIFNELRQTWADRIGHDELARLEERLTTFVGDETIRLGAPGWVSQDLPDVR